MKKIILSIAMLALMAVAANAQHNGQVCDPAKEKPTAKNTKAVKGNYGTPVSKDGAIDVKTLPAKMANEKEQFVKIEGTVVAACQVKGCWMTADLGDGKTMRIRFKDYGFFVPKDSGGKKFYAQGIASWYETSVAELQHYAEDAGKSKEDIAKITEPKRELVFLAEGVLLENK
ncbi:MAG TPA: DUF4920 domain-containing protein [Chitinophagales bacterium]|nr:DUF4920 domain-containing protein [Chitinophagales bacterium]